MMENNGRLSPLTQYYSLPKTVAPSSLDDTELLQHSEQIFNLACAWWQKGFSQFLPKILQDQEKCWLQKTLLEKAVSLGVREADMAVKFRETQQAIDFHIWLGAGLTYHLWTRRPVQIISTLSVDDFSLLPYLNDIFALEFGWGITFTWMRKKAEVKGTDADFLVTAQDLLHKDNRGPSELFPNMILGQTSVRELAYFFDLLLRS